MYEVNKKSKMDFLRTTENYKNYFENRIEKYGDNIKSLWNSSSAQIERFKILTEIGNLNQSNILDVGCGFGDLFSYLSDSGIKINSYIGIDIAESAINLCKQKHSNQKFFLTDIFSYEPKDIDYCIASGIFFLPSDDWDNYVVELINKMFEISSKGVSVNFLSTYSLNPDNESFYANPSHVLDLIQSRISVNSVLRHDYRQNDFTVYIYKSNN
jgi:SAM-dependent methyltransferase